MPNNTQNNNGQNKKEKITAGTEKLFFKYILDNPSQFEKIEPSYFKTGDIKFVYSVIREEFMRSKKVPSKKQIQAMVKMRSEEHDVSSEVIKKLVNVSLEDYGEDWVNKKFKAWKLENITKDHVLRSVNYLREVDTTDYENVKDVAARIKNITNEIDLVDDDESLGEDFDDPAAHKQDEEVDKIPTGWNTMNTVLGGGWDYSSLSLLIGETSVGKSMWLNNISVKAANEGKNVLFISLEMSSKKCMKRMGSQRLRIPIDQYDEKSKDEVFMKRKLNELKYGDDGVFEKKVGKIFVRKFPTSSLTITELDNFIHKFQEKKNINIDCVVLDYINLMGVEKGYDFSSMLFLKGKHIAEGLRYIADKYEVSMITATQTDKSVWGASDLSLKDIPESKAVAETSDLVIGIIRNPEMKKNNKYRLKFLKQRDGELSEDQIKFDFNPKFLLMENDEFYGSAA